MDDLQSIARTTADLIIDDLTNRKALDDEWGQIDDDIQEEIREVWAGIIQVALIEWTSAARAEGYRAGIEDAAAEIVDYRDSIEDSGELRELEQVIRALPDLPVIYADLSLTAYAPESGSAAIEPQEDR